jgi:hypothetical protein
MKIGRHDLEQIYDHHYKINDVWQVWQVDGKWSFCFKAINDSWHPEQQGHVLRLFLNILTLTKRKG